MTIGEKIDKLIEEGLKNSLIKLKGFSLSTIKYRRARLKNPLAYGRIMQRNVKNNRNYRHKKKLSTSK